MKKILAALFLLLAAPVHAQIQNRPADPPFVTADNDAWYRLGEPIQLDGDVYYRAGAAVFFDGNVMVRTGHFNGVPLYANTTLEPNSVVFVPVTRGLMQPYERRRSGGLAGTTGSRAPSFPVSVSNAQQQMTQAPGAPTSIASDSVSPSLREAGAVGTSGRATPSDARGVTRSRDVVGTSGVALSRRSTQPAIVSLRRPESSDGLWISYAGGKWISAGLAVSIDAGFTLSGDYAGFPVFTRPAQPDVIYLPTREGFVAPYKRKP